MIGKLLKRNPLTEYTQFFSRFTPAVICILLTISFIKEAYFDAADQYNDVLFGWFLMIYIFFLLEEFHYYCMAKRHDSWQNPFNPDYGDRHIIRLFREKFYAVLRFFIYIEWYFYKVAIIYWVIECIYHYWRAPYTITLVNIGIGIFLFPLLNLLGKKLMKNFYFNELEARKETQEEFDV